MGQPSIEHRSKEAVLIGFDMYDTPYYAVFQDKCLKFYNDTNDGEKAKETLSECLDALISAKSYAIYHVRFYKTCPDESPNWKDNPTGSFNFKLDECRPDMQYQYPMAGVSGMGEIAELKKEIAALKLARDEPDDRPQWQKTLSSISGVLDDNPQLANTILPAISNILSGIVSKFMPNQKNIMPAAEYMAGVAGVPDDNKVANDDYIMESVDRLMAIDTDFPIHLKQLADMATNNPSKYFMALKFLS